jgi:phosphoglycerol transferase MdoB-like AlkP superfamily enzyme
LLGIETSKDMQLGADVFSEDHEEFVVFRDGRFVTKDFVYAGNTCYEKETGLATDAASCAPYTERAAEELDYSDQIINGDLLRFYDVKTGNLLIDEANQSK